MAEQELKKSLFDLFASSQETLEEAKKKSNEESGKRANYLRFSQDGTYAVRILPLAPVIDADGNPLPMERKGYEYPLRSYMLKIEGEKKDSKGKPQINYVSVCNAKHAFPKLDSDLLELYVQTACDLYQDDETLCKKLRETSFNGGLKYDSRRCMYVIDCDKPGDGIQILQLSYAQYKELEERKLNLWNKLSKNGKTVPCPICSISNAYPVEISRKTENKKVNYSFNIDTVSGVNELDEDTIQTLLDMPRLPETLYRYTRFHLEATIAFLHQMDEKYDIDVMNSEAIKDCIEQIKLLLPADDQSHFTLGQNSENSATTGNALNDLWARFDKIDEEGLDDKSAEGQELRTSIKEYIEDHELNIKITRSKSNQMLLDEIEKLEAESEEESEEEPAEEEAPASSHRNNRHHKPVEEEEEDGTEADDTEEPAEEEEADTEEEPAEEEEPVSRRRRERNEDTNEPAVRHERRGARPHRR